MIRIAGKQARLSGLSNAKTKLDWGKESYMISTSELLIIIKNAFPVIFRNREYFEIGNRFEIKEKRIDAIVKIFSKVDPEKVSNSSLLTILGGAHDKITKYKRIALERLANDNV